MEAAAPAEEELQADINVTVLPEIKGLPKLDQSPGHSQQLALRNRHGSSYKTGYEVDNVDDAEKHAPQATQHQASPSPIEMINTANFDPFGSMAVELPPHLMSLLMDQTRTILLRQVTNRTANNSVALAAADEMMQMTIRDKPLFYAMIAAAMRFFRTARRDENIPHVEALVEARSIELLNQRMANINTALTETNITAIVACGYCGKVYPMRRGRLPRQSFLKELQDLNVYGRMVVVEAHVQGLSKLVPMLGGIYNLKTPGLSQLLSFCDLFDCTRKLQQPTVPFVPHTQTFRKNQAQDGISASEHYLPPSDLRMLGLGFAMVWSSANSLSIPELLGVLAQFSDFTFFLDNFVEGRYVLHEPVELTDARNYSQHALMWLPTSRALSTTSQVEVDAQYETCRLATLLYSLLVVFPLPPTVGLFEKPVRRLRTEVAALSSLQQGFDGPRRKLHYWILTMGGVASIGLSERQYFLKELIDQSDRLSIKSWQEALDTLKHFLWHPTTNNKDGLDLWNDMQAARTSTAAD